MAIGSQRFLISSGGGEEIVFITPRSIYIITTNNLLKMIQKATNSCRNVATLKVSKDVHEILRRELKRKHGTRVEKVHTVHDLWVELVEGVKMLRIE